MHPITGSRLPDPTRLPASTREAHKSQCVVPHTHCVGARAAGTIAPWIYLRRQFLLQSARALNEQWVPWPTRHETAQTERRSMQ